MQCGSHRTRTLPSCISSGTPLHQNVLECICTQCSASSLYPGAPLPERVCARSHWRELAAKLGGADRAGRQLGKLLQGIGELLASEDATQQACNPKRLIAIKSSNDNHQRMNCKLVNEVHLPRSSSASEMASAQRG